MFIRLTNADEKLKGSPVVLNVDKIVSVFTLTEEETERTFVYAGELGTWIVEESVDTIVEMLDK